MVSASARFDIGAWRILDRLELALARNARAGRFHYRRILLLQPAEPVRPPAPLMLRRAFDERIQRLQRPVVDPELILLGGRRIDDPGDVTGSGEHELLRPREMGHDLPHALGRRNMILAAS